MMRDTPAAGSPIEHRTETGAYHAYHDWSSEQPLSQTVIEAFTSVAGAEGETDRPLYDSLDTGALDQLFATSTRREPRTRGHLQFVHDGYEIEIHTNGLVRIQPPSDDVAIR